MGAPLQSIVWNARGVALSDRGQRDATLQYIRGLATGRHAVCLQEVHGLNGEVLADIQSVLPGWLVFHSCIFGDDGLPIPSYAGVAILICPELSAFSEVGHTVLVHGRIHYVDITVNHNCSAGGDPDPRTMTFWNIHNYDLSLGDMNTIAEHANLHLERDRLSPWRFTTFLFGDFNYRIVGDQTWTRGKAEPNHRILTTPIPSGSHKARWEAILSEFVELFQPHPTHFTSASDLLTRIDRGYTTMPPSVLTRMGATSAVTHGPDTYSLMGLSDHAAIGFSLYPKFLRTNFTYSFPKAWFMTQAFSTRMEEYIAAVQWDDLDPLEKHTTYKYCLKSAAFEKDILP